MAEAVEKTDSRALARQRRREQLILATIKCISRRGMSGTTMGDVAREAGLSQGIVNLHFESKENLLKETLRYLSDEYDAHFYKALEKSGPGAAEKLLGLMKLDLKPSVCDRRKLAVWFAFWGEAKAMPTYQKICAEHNDGYDREMQALCRQIIEEGGYKNVTPSQVTDALASMTDGLWLSCLMNPKTFDREAALQAVKSYLRATFPKHYD